MKEINIGDKIHSEIDGQWVSVEICDMKPRWFGGYKYLCKHTVDYYKDGSFIYSTKEMKWVNKNKLIP